MIENLGERALALGCDVTRSEAVKAALDKAVEAFGRVDFAFNNAVREVRKMTEVTRFPLAQGSCSPSICSGPLETREGMPRLMRGRS